MRPAALGLLRRPSQLIRFTARRDTEECFHVPVRRPVRRDARGWPYNAGMSLSAAQAEFVRTSR
jgi:hypothetical protein